MIFSLFELSKGITSNTAYTTRAKKLSEKALQLVTPSANAAPLGLGGQNFTYCCIVALSQLNDKTGVSIVGSLENLSPGQIPCGASYSGTILALDNDNISSTMELIAK